MANNSIQSTSIITGNDTPQGNQIEAINVTAMNVSSANSIDQIAAINVTASEVSVKDNLILSVNIVTENAGKNMLFMYY